jgi:hypothetical protein
MIFIKEIVVKSYSYRIYCQLSGRGPLYFIKIKNRFLWIPIWTTLKDNDSYHKEIIKCRSIAETEKLIASIETDPVKEVKEVDTKKE